MSSMKALVVIDMLEDFFREGNLRVVRKELAAQINLLVVRVRRAGIPVIWVRQEFRDNLEDAFLAMREKHISITIAGTEGSQILEELKPLPDDYEVVKKRYSAFYGTGLDELLEKQGITELILAGVNTHACIRTSAIDAYQRDLKVTIPRECVASNDLAHHEITLSYLNREISTVVGLEALFRSI